MARSLVDREHYAAFAMASAVYASLLQPLYTANVLLAPVKDDPLSRAGQPVRGAWPASPASADAERTT